MLFLQQWFWVFAAGAIPVYWVCPPPLKLYWLLLASLVFHYHFAGPAGMAPILVLASLTYLAGLAVSTEHRRGAFAPVCVLLVSTLAFFKYSAFLVATGAHVLALTGVHTPAWMAAWRNPAAPLAISFFTFEFVHYLYEIRFNGRTPIRSPVEFATFAVFFPTLACGPIKRYPDFVPQLRKLHTPDGSTLWPALRRLIRGLFKKICIADLLVEWIHVFEDVPHYKAPLVVGLAAMQGLRIYYDFAGYSDIAIALAQLLGVRVPENFNRPYLATSLQEFWRRWHMSLSSWIRDYIYIPLGGNRAHRAASLFVAMLLCGLWHGADWHFALWGGYHGAGLMAEAALRRASPTVFSDGRGWRVVRWGICYAFVTYGWLLFFYPIRTVYQMTKAVIVWS